MPGIILHLWHGKKTSNKLEQSLAATCILWLLYSADSHRHLDGSCFLPTLCSTCPAQADEQKKKQVIHCLFGNKVVAVIAAKVATSKTLNHSSSLASYELWAILVVAGAGKPLNLWALAMQSMREWVSVWTFSCLPTPGTHGKQGVDPTGIKHALLISPELLLAPQRHKQTKVNMKLREDRADYTLL